MIKPFCKISEPSANKTESEAMIKLHEWLGGLQVHKSHYSRGDCPMRQYTDHWINIQQLWRDYSSKLDTISNVFPQMSSEMCSPKFIT